MDKASEDLLQMLQDKIDFGESLVLKLEPLENIQGIEKLQKKIRQEIDFLNRLSYTKKVKLEQLLCSNLRHLEAMVECATRPGVYSVCKIFHMSDGSKMVIDIICDEGRIWTKVIARNPRSLSALSAGNASYGARSILDQAKDYLECAKQYPCFYQQPKVVFEFMSGIESRLANKLRSVGVIVKGEILPNASSVESEDSDSSDDDASTQENDDAAAEELDECGEEHPEILVLNLDVTAMMAYISNMTNGFCNFVFKQEVLTQQCLWEMTKPVKPVLDKLFEGKELICCETAWNDFEKIVNTLGGPMERDRMEELRKRITVYPDDFGGPDDPIRENLKVRGSIRLRSKIIFNFGHRQKALTVSANDGFVRAAMQQGVMYTTFTHQPRALTEGKEPTAKKLAPL